MGFITATCIPLVVLTLLFKVGGLLTWRDTPVVGAAMFAITGLGPACSLLGPVLPFPLYAVLMCVQPVFAMLCCICLADMISCGSVSWSRLVMLLSGKKPPRRTPMPNVIPSPTH